MKKTMRKSCSGQQVPRDGCRKVMVFGTFDLFHPGHMYFLKEARKRGDFLVVVVARDATVKRLKKKTPYDGESERKRKVEESCLADKVILGSLKDEYDAIRKERPDVICLGYDQRFFISGLGRALKSMGIGPEIARIGSHRPDKYKTSILKIKKKIKYPR